MKSHDLTKHLPEGVIWLRAAVSSIPVVGSALDHLLFDKADEIRLKNLEAALSAISEQIKNTDQAKIDRAWFETEEALAAFKVMADKVSYEPDKEKVSAMGRIVASCGNTGHSRDRTKISVIEHISRLSVLQIKVLAAVSRTSAQNRKIRTGATFWQTATAIWTSDIASTLSSGPTFWPGTMKLEQELEILESYNTIRRLQLLGPSEPGYLITSIGVLAASYVRTAGLS